MKITKLGIAELVEYDNLFYKSYLDYMMEGGMCLCTDIKFSLFVWVNRDGNLEHAFYCKFMLEYDQVESAFIRSYNQPYYDFYGEVKDWFKNTEFTYDIVIPEKESSIYEPFGDLTYIRHCSNKTKDEFLSSSRFEMVLWKLKQDFEVMRKVSRFQLEDQSDSQRKELLTNYVNSLFLPY